MKYFSKTSLPESVVYNGHTYTRDADLSPLANMTVSTASLAQRAAMDNKKIVIVNVLSKNLRGKLDLYQKPYRPTMWVFSRVSINLNVIDEYTGNGEVKTHSI